MPSITTGELNLLKDFLYRTAGIDLGEGKEYLVSARLNEVCRTLQISSISNLIGQLHKGKKAVSVAVLEAMTTNETSFFRDAGPFGAITTDILPDLIEKNRSKKQLNIWCAASSTGQEPYSLAMTIRDRFPELNNWRVKILATDIAEGKVLEKARAGTYTQLEVSRGLPAPLLIKYFKQKGRDWEISQDIRDMVTFKKVNLLEIPAFLGTFDLLLCRNVLIYFDNPTKQRILGSLQKHLCPQGYLILGGSELLLGLNQKLQRYSVGGATCYRHEGAA